MLNMTELPAQAKMIIDRIVSNTVDKGDTDNLVIILDSLPIEERATMFLYWDMRLDGASANIAEMLALQTPPMSNTDREFLQGHCNGNQFDKGPLTETVANRLKAAAEAGGQNVTGKVYLGGLARYPGDPEAWVSGRGDVKRVVESRNWKCSGSVEHNPDSRSDEKILAAVPTVGSFSSDE